MTTIRPTQGAIGEETPLPLPRLLSDACTVTLPLSPRRDIRASVSVGALNVLEINATRVVVVPASVDPLTVTF